MPNAIARWVLPVPGGPSRTNVLLGGQGVELREVRHRFAAQARLEREVEVLDRLARGEPRGLDPCLAAVGVAAVDLGPQQDGGELLVGPFLGASAVGELGQRRGLRG